MDARSKSYQYYLTPDFNLSPPEASGFFQLRERAVPNHREDPKESVARPRESNKPSNTTKLTLSATPCQMRNDFSAATCSGVTGWSTSPRGVTNIWRCSCFNFGSSNSPSSNPKSSRAAIKLRMTLGRGRPV